MAGLLDDGQEYLRRSGRNLGGLLDWLAGGARAGAEPTMALMRGDALDQPLLPTADSGGRIGAVASAIGSTVMPVKAPAGALGAGPVVRSANAALDMSPEARAARAAEQGYNVDVLHGTNGPEFSAFDPERIGSNTGAHARGYYFTDNPELANRYAKRGIGDAGYEGGSVIPAKLKMKNPFVIDFAEEARTGKYGFMDMEDAVSYAKANGHDGAIIKNWGDGRGTGDQYVVFEPQQVRSRFAAFDPARAGEADLLASRAPLSGLLSPPLTVDDLKDRL